MYSLSRLPPLSVALPSCEGNFPLESHTPELGGGGGGRDAHVEERDMTLKNSDRNIFSSQASVCLSHVSILD
jgi:hypothetical protein